MDSNELKTVLEKHRKWINGEVGGEKADLHGADLRDADLRYADLHGAYLREADLQGADLREANLQGADLDFSCFPLWCGGSHFKADEKLVFQLLAHITTLEVEGDDFKAIKDFILPYARKSHRAFNLKIND